MSIQDDADIITRLIKDPQSKIILRIENCEFFNNIKDSLKKGFTRVSDCSNKSKKKQTLLKIVSVL